MMACFFVPLKKQGKKVKNHCWIICCYFRSGLHYVCCATFSWKIHLSRWTTRWVKSSLKTNSGQNWQMSDEGKSILTYLVSKFPSNFPLHRWKTLANGPTWDTGEVWQDRSHNINTVVVKGEHPVLIFIIRQYLSLRKRFSKINWRTH